MDETQAELALPFPEFSKDLPLIPARMVNEYQYCPRLAYLEWVQGEWADSADTVEGRHRHRRVDKRSGDLPEPDGVAEEPFKARSITLSSNRLGLIAKIDMIEGDSDTVIPIDYKRGKRPHVAKGAYEPERVQVCVQGMLLEEHGYHCKEGALYFVESKERVRVEFDEELRAAASNAINGLRLIAAGGQSPPPLEDSPKCPRCSLVGICLPDEVNFLKKFGPEPRPLFVGHHDALPLYVQANAASVKKKGETLEIYIKDEKVNTARLAEVSQLVLMGNIYVSTPTLHELMRREIPITWHSFGGWFLGHSQGIGHKNIELRAAQYRASFDSGICQRLAKGLVKAKIQNCRTFMRRNWRSDEDNENVMNGFKQDIEAAGRVKDITTLLGVEGTAAARYFGHFDSLIKKDSEDPETLRFDFTQRNRRPPTDPINALLSYAYSLLVRTWAVTLSAVGLDPYCGYYHQPRYGRPALALDLMEPFRPLIADSSVIMCINNGEIRPSDFISAAGSVSLTNDGRKRFIAGYERRLSQEVTHPLFGYKVSYRRLLEIQARLLGRHLLGEIPEYPNFITR